MSKKKRLKRERDELRREVEGLREQLRTTPTLYFAALAGIVQGQRNPTADAAERDLRARVIEKTLEGTTTFPGCGEGPLIRAIREHGDFDEAEVFRRPPAGGGPTSEEKEEYIRWLNSDDSDNGCTT